MRFEVGVVAHFSARHHLVGNFGAASQPHEHDYRVDAEVVGDTLGADGTLFDITRLQIALSEVIAVLDGQDLNGIAILVEPNPTAEVVARYFYERIASVLADQGLSQLRTRVWESAEAYASYAGDLA